MLERTHTETQKRDITEVMRATETLVRIEDKGEEDLGFKRGNYRGRGKFDSSKRNNI